MNEKIQKQIRKGDDPILKQVCMPVSSGDDLRFLEKLEHVCRKSMTAVGLAAPQIGVAKQAIILNCRDKHGTIKRRIMLNPKITAVSQETTVEKEGCLSYPEVYKDSRRPGWIEVSYQDSRTFYDRWCRLEGFEARVASHEIDHLSGVCKVGDPAYPEDEHEPEIEPEYAKTTPRSGQSRVHTAALFAGIMGLASIGSAYGRRR